VLWFRLVLLQRQGKQPTLRPLAVMPPAPGKRASHLIVGLWKTSELRVLSLPGLALVHTHRLEGIEVIGLAADPCWHCPCCVRPCISFHARPGLAAAGHAAARSSSSPCPRVSCSFASSRQRGTGNATAASAFALGFGGRLSAQGGGGAPTAWAVAGISGSSSGGTGWSSTMTRREGALPRRRGSREAGEEVLSLGRSWAPLSATVTQGEGKEGALACAPCKALCLRRAATAAPARPPCQAERCVPRQPGLAGQQRSTAADASASHCQCQRRRACVCAGRLPRSAPHVGVPGSARWGGWGAGEGQGGGGAPA